jgi:SAM-dependent methyltransferase
MKFRFIVCVFLFFRIDSGHALPEQSCAETLLQPPSSIIDIQPWQKYLSDIQSAAKKLAVEKFGADKVRWSYPYILGLADLTDKTIYLSGYDDEEADFLPEKLSDWEREKLERVEERKIQSTGDIFTLLGKISDAQWLRPSSLEKEVREKLLPSPQVADELRERALRESLKDPQNSDAQHFLTEFEVPLPILTANGMCEWSFDLWSEPRLHNQRPDFYSALLRASELSHEPWKGYLQRLLYLTLKRDHAPLEQALSGKEMRSKLKEYAFFDWMGDASNPAEMENISKWLSNEPGHFVDIGSGTGEPLLLLGPRFPNIHFTGIDVVTEKNNSANQMATQLGIPNVKFIAGDFSGESFRVPTADYYYLFAPVMPDTLKKIVGEMVAVASNQPKTTIIARAIGPSPFQALLDLPFCKVEGDELARVFVIICDHKL